MRIRIISSSPSPSLGILGRLLRRMQLPVAVAQYQHVGVLRTDDPLILLGGTMSVCDPLDRPMRGFMNALERHIASGGTSIGLCLGAQIQARVLGGSVYPHPSGLREIGYYPMNASVHHRSTDLPPGCYYSWHYDVIEPAASMRVTLANEQCAVQAFRFGERVHGFQFHPEIDLRMIRRWTAMGAARLHEPGAQDVSTQQSLHARVRSRNSRAFGAFLHRLLNERVDSS